MSTKHRSFTTAHARSACAIRRHQPVALMVGEGKDAGVIVIGCQPISPKFTQVQRPNSPMQSPSFDQGDDNRSPIAHISAMRQADRNGSGTVMAGASTRSSWSAISAPIPKCAAASRRPDRLVPHGDQRKLEGQGQRRAQGTHRMAFGRRLQHAAGRGRGKIPEEGHEGLCRGPAADPQMAGPGRHRSLHHRNGAEPLSRRDPDARQAAVQPPARRRGRRRLWQPALARDR
jgi:hypothetical protein